MTRIDPVRLAEIFRTLASQKKLPPVKAQTSNKTINKDRLASSRGRDKEVLKARLKNRLVILRDKSDDFATEAPFVAIQEIMSWEFGDQFLNHPEFKYITKSIVDSIDESPALTQHMNTLINEIIK